MAAYTAEVIWSRGDQVFTDNRYSRAHRLRFDGGIDVPGSASPHVVPLPYSDPQAIDPEEAFVAALSSCHMLWFLSLAAGRGYCVDQYHDAAQGWLGRNADGKEAMTRVELRPTTTFSGPQQPTREALLDLHHAAHEACFIANSVRCDVVCHPQ